MAALIRDFESLHPGVRVEYDDLNSTELYNRYRSETAARQPSAAVLWSSAMDLQMKLAPAGPVATAARRRRGRR